MALTAFRESIIGRTANTAFRAAVDLLYPARCVNCGEFNTPFCQQCEEQMTSAPAVPRCGFCQAHWEGEHNCPRCFGWKALDGARSAFDYEGPARSLVRSLKYRNNLALAPLMARWLAPLLERERCDAVFAVPLHRSRLRYRGYNQSELLLAHLAADPQQGHLVRVRKTRAQYGLSTRDRSNNVAGAFTYRGPSLRGRRVAIIDDVITTGATANECARVLRDAGATSVVAVAFARANYEPAPPEAQLNL